MGLETDDPEGEEGIDFLQREQNKNLLKVLQYKEKSKMMKEKENAESLHERGQTVTFVTVPQRTILELPSADDILH